MSPDVQPQQRWWTIRRQGLALSAAGMLISACMYMSVIREAERRAESIDVSEKGIAAGVIVIVFGLPMIILGEKARPMMNMHRIDLREIRWWVWAVFLGSLVAGFSAIALIHLHLKSLGYTRIYQQPPAPTRSVAPEPVSIP